MPVSLFPNGIEPANSDGEIWRFMEVWKLRDLLQTRELYFRRADKMPDDGDEGIPPKAFMRAHFGVRDEQTENNDEASDAQFREGFYLSCWNVFEIESARLWVKFAQFGVAICSRYALLKSALNDLPDNCFLGLTRYGGERLPGRNVLQAISTKHERHRFEHEVRALIWLPDPHAGINRHFDAENRAFPRPLTEPTKDIPEYLRRSVNPEKLITGIVVSPWASADTIGEVAALLQKTGYSFPIRASELTPYARFLPKEHFD
jgi:hypothetical protein